MTVMADPQFAHFAATARLLGDEARRAGLAAPGFRSPPRMAGADRTIRRFADGATLVAVRVKGRRPEAFERDMVEGVVVANRLRGAEAETWRRRLLDLLSASVEEGVAAAA